MMSSTTGVRGLVACAAALVALAVATAHAKPDAVPVYNGVQGAALAVQGADGVADLTSTTAYAARPKVAVSKHQTITLSVRCTNAGVTVKVRLVRGTIDDAGTFRPWSTSSASLTSHATYTLKAQGATYFPCDDAYFDSSDLPYFMVVIDSISASTCCVDYAAH